MAREPFEIVVAEHGQVVMRVCRGILGPADAEDAWAETFLAALRSYPDLAPDSNVRAWLVTIAHNKAIDAIRRRARRAIPTAAVPEKPTSATAVDAEFDGVLRDRLAALPPTQRRAVIYRHLADLSYAEIAELLDSNETAARRSVADGIKKLRHSYRGESGGESA